MTRPKKPKAHPPITTCSVCNMPIPEAAPSRSRRLVCLPCMKSLGVDIVTRCHVCGTIYKSSVCEKCYAPPERSR
jgi:hypothetical protein